MKRAHSSAAPAPGRTNSELERAGGKEGRSDRNAVAKSVRRRRDWRPRRASERAQQLNGPTGCMKGGGKQGKREGRKAMARCTQRGLNRPNRARHALPSLMMGWSAARALVNGTFYLSSQAKYTYYISNSRLFCIYVYICTLYMHNIYMSAF